MTANWRDYAWENILPGIDIEALADNLEDGWRARPYLSPHAVVDLYINFMKREEFIEYVNQIND